MDCIAAASDLRELLIAHSSAQKQVSVLGCYLVSKRQKKKHDQMSELSQQTMVSALDGNRCQDLHLSLRLSVCEGVKLMYHNYQNKKWSQIQETARSIIQNLEGDLDSEPTLPMPSPGDNTSVDKAADKWSMAFCEFYRDD